jgi:DNA-directed RNA polymerase specialized sigma subunit
MMDAKAAARARTEMLKQLREQHKASVEKTQELLREQKRVQQAVCKSVRERPKTVPEIAAEIDMPTHEVLWYMTAFKKYGIVIENGMCGDYPLYQRVED